MRFSAGFSLIELTIAIFLLGVAGALTYPMLSNSWNNQKLRHYSLLTLAEFQHARQLAITSERDVVLRIDRDYLCTGFADEAIDKCQPSAFLLEHGFQFKHNYGRNTPVQFTAGRGFAAFSAGQVAIVKASHAEVSGLIISSLGRIRWCQWGTALHGVAHCDS
ncbi:hypothetical protein CWE09_06605 [Aliidiomarina minuta]|uniref:Prepilin-type cleavage/methylation domain-containing protein n=1 Tax=Aliidiomarina minuta TaxID=880057 RepID=A0A432W8E8_9GAMM|nr:prepilin-type N-terminal cleavage/methylation domain-containing protein [Aliidiomarina minuta]RUO26374.1 hypothetical protein CWE09_06605 [Aliidiomarina minuta]